MSAAANRAAAVMPAPISPAPISPAPISPDWIAVDWGTSNLRAWAMGPDGPLAEAASDDGMGRLSRDQFEPTLLALIGGWITAPVTAVIACGMAGSRQGWLEAPYRAVPCTPLDPGTLVPVPTHDTRIAVRLVPGLKQPRPADVMRGEETQIAGVLAMHSGFDGVICLPGTHSKWAQISAGEVVSFQTCMTGELFALLSTQSVLRHGLGGEGWDDAAFTGALSDAIARPERTGTRLFALRAEGLLNDLAPAIARARLSGLLIGMELAATRPYWLGQAVMIVGESSLASHYATALAAQGAAPRLISATDAVLAGLTAARIKEPAR